MRREVRQVLPMSFGQTENRDYVGQCVCFEVSSIFPKKYFFVDYIHNTHYTYEYLLLPIKKRLILRDTKLGVLGVCYFVLLFRVVDGKYTRYVKTKVDVAI
jgi:hypothetical protein